MEDLIWLFCNAYTYKNIILYTTNTFDFHWLMKENLFKKLNIYVALCQSQS